MLADCPVCKKEVEAKLLDCDSCFERFLEEGGDPIKYSELTCDHIACTECDEPLF